MHTQPVATPHCAQIKNAVTNGWSIQNLAKSHGPVPFVFDVHKARVPTVKLDVPMYKKLDVPNVYS